MATPRLEIRVRAHCRDARNALRLARSDAHTMPFVVSLSNHAFRI